MKSLFFCLSLIILPPFSILSIAQSANAAIQLDGIEKAYLKTKVLSFDGNIKYYTNPQNTSPSEIMMVSYRREGDKVFITIGEQMVIYDGKYNIVINEDTKVIYVSSEKPSKENSTPLGMVSKYVKFGAFNIKMEDYLGNKVKIIMTEPDKSVASSIEMIVQKETHFIDFARMIIDKEDEDMDEDINKKKFEFSYYHYKMVLDEKIDTSKYIVSSKNGKTITYKGIGKYKDFEIVVI